MRQKSESDLQAEIFKAMGNPVRVIIIKTLADGERTISALCRIAGVSQSNVSRHALRLKRVGIVADRRAGPHVYYSLVARDLLSFMKKASDVQRKHLSDRHSLIKS